MTMCKKNTKRIMTKCAFAASETKLFIPTFSVSAGREGWEGPGRWGRRDGEKVAMTNTMLLPLGPSSNQGPTTPTLNNSQSL